MPKTVNASAVVHLHVPSDLGAIAVVDTTPHIAAESVFEHHSRFDEFRNETVGEAVNCFAFLSVTTE